MSIMDSVKKAGFRAVYGYLDKDPDANIPKLMDWVDRFAGNGPNSFPGQRAAFRAAIENPEGNWYKLIRSMWTDIDDGVRRTFFENFMLNGNLIGWGVQEEARARYGSNIPWAILLDPTSACNLHCTGCWAAEYGNRLNLSFDEIDGIITQGKKLGVYIYIYTGGEPLVRRDDLIALCNKHTDCEFLCFTNATLIDEDFADQMLCVKNFIYMPVGNDAAPELMPSPAQREAMYDRVRAYRRTKPIFIMDFQNDGEYVGGCIAGGRRYLHINANGDVDPCVFIHYSDCNIRSMPLLDCLRSPMFMAYHDGQPFNDNHLKPCPMLENPDKLRGMVEQTGAKSTDLQSPETAEHLCAKCDGYAAAWDGTARRLWACSHGGCGHKEAG